MINFFSSLLCMSCVVGMCIAFPLTHLFLSESRTENRSRRRILFIGVIVTVFVWSIFAIFVPFILQSKYTLIKEYFGMTTFFIGVLAILIRTRILSPRLWYGVLKEGSTLEKQREKQKLNIVEKSSSVLGPFGVLYGMYAVGMYLIMIVFPAQLIGSSGGFHDIFDTVEIESELIIATFIALLLTYILMKKKLGEIKKR